MNIFTGDISLGERLLGGFCWFALILFVGLIITEVVKNRNRKEKPFSIMQRIILFILAILYALRFALYFYYDNGFIVNLLIAIVSTIFVIYTFGVYYVQERQKGHQNRKGLK